MPPPSPPPPPFLLLLLLPIRPPTILVVINLLRPPPTLCCSPPSISLSSSPCGVSHSGPLLMRLQAFITREQSPSNRPWICRLVNSAAVALSVNASAALSEDWAANKCLRWGFFLVVVGGGWGVPLSTADCSQGWDFRSRMGPAELIRD